MKPMKLHEAIDLLESNGFTLIRSNGHKVYAKGSVRIAIAHQRVVSVGVVRSVVKAVRQAKSEFLEQQIG
jgi:predicted RNA binding protein YcfA (HicA-like mRNA interferase family)